MAREHMVEKIQRLIRNGMRMRIEKVRLREKISLHGNAPCQVHLLHDARREGIQKLVSIESMVARIQQKILEVEQ